MFNVVGRLFNRQSVKLVGFGIGFLIIIFGLYFWHLGSLTKGLSPAEVSSRSDSSNLSVIVNNPVNLPHKLLQYASQKVSSTNPFWQRFPSVLLMLVFLGCFFFVVKSWFGKTIAIYMTLLFASLPTVILLARSATPNILLLTPIAVLASYVWLTKTGSKNLAFAIFCLLIGLTLYVPGVFLFVLAAIIIWRQEIAAEISDINIKIGTAAIVASLLIIIPLVWSIVKNIEVAKDLVFLSNTNFEVGETLSSIAWAFLGLFWRTRDHSNLILGRLAILNATYIVLSLFGLFIMWTKARKVLYGLLALIILSILEAGIAHQTIVLAMSLPAIGILAAAGLRYLYGEWNSVFPLNPLPRALAVMLVSVLVALNIFVGVHYSLIAWPRSLPTQETYVLK
jgi:4-amino-4-deoxy-L-arabinose transferase-like glycosyltransferase